MKIRYYLIKLIKNKKLKIIKLVQLKKKRKDRMLDGLGGVLDLGGLGEGMWGVVSGGWIGLVRRKLIY